MVFVHPNFFIVPHIIDNCSALRFDDAVKYRTRFPVWSVDRAPASRSRWQMATASVSLQSQVLLMASRAVTRRANAGGADMLAPRFSRSPAI